MTKRVEIPTEEEVETCVRLMTERTGTPPPVIAVARELQLSNATFWRYFPEIARTVADARRASRRNTEPGPGETDEKQSGDGTGDVLLAKSAARTARWEKDLQAAAAQIQRLTLENAALRAQLAEASAVLPLRPRNK
jgi:hypothetical protein